MCMTWRICSISWSRTGNRFRRTFAASDASPPYAVATRYPGPGVPVSEAQYLEALEIAETVVHWAATLLHGASADL